MLLHVDFFVSSMEKSLEFYVGKLGMEILEDRIIEGDLVEYVSNGQFDSYRLVLLKISSQGAMMELMQFLDRSGNLHTGYVPIPHQGSTTILVHSLEKKVEDLKRQGIFPDSKIFEILLERFGKSRIVFYKDPDGHTIELLQMLPSSQ